MNYLRERDETCFRLCKLQARLMERASEDKIPSYFFAKVYFHSGYVRKMDDLSLLDTLIGEEEIYSYVSNNIKMTRGVVYPKEVMYWIGYLLREWSYRYQEYSISILKKVSLKYLASVYNPYHSLDILKAIERIAEDNGIDLDEDPEAKLQRILRKTIKII